MIISLIVNEWGELPHLFVKIDLFNCGAFIHCKLIKEIREKKTKSSLSDPDDQQ